LADDVIKRTAKPTPIMTSSTKNPKPKTKKFFFILNYKTFSVFREFEQLSSSIAWRVAAGLNLAWEGKSYLSRKFFIFVKNWVFIHNFGSRYAWN